MKKSLLFFSIFFFLISLFLVSATDIEFNSEKNIFNPGESALLKITFPLGFKLTNDLSVSDFSLLDSFGNRYSTNIGLIKSIEKENSNDVYYVYFEVPNVADKNFSIGFIDIKYFMGSELKQGTFFYSFFTNNETNALVFNPGYIQLLNIESFDQPTLTVSIRNKFSTINASVQSEQDFLMPVFSSVNVPAGDLVNFNIKTKLINVNKDILKGNLLFNYGSTSYKLPVVITRKGFVSSNNTINKTVTVIVNKTNQNLKEITGQIDTLVLESPPVTIVDESFKQGEAQKGEFIFRNKGLNDLYDLEVSYNGLEDILSSERKRIDVLKSGEAVKINLFINTTNAKKTKYKGDLVLKAMNNAFVSIPFSFNIALTPVINNAGNDVQVLNSSLPNLDTSNHESGGSFFGWILLILIIILMGLLGYYFYNKQKPKQKAYENLIDSFKR